MGDRSIGEVARAAGVTPEALRYYERVGVLERAPRNAAGHRQYAARVLDELRLLKAAQSAGFSLEEIARMLAYTRQNPIPCRPMCELVEKQVGELDARIAELQDARGRLTAALAACDHEESCVVADRLRFEPSASLA